MITLVVRQSHVVNEVSLEVFCFRDGHCLFLQRCMVRALLLQLISTGFQKLLRETPSIQLQVTISGIDINLSLHKKQKNNNNKQKNE